MDKVVSIDCSFMGGSLKKESTSFSLSVKGNSGEWSQVTSYVSQMGNSSVAFTTASLTSDIIKNAFGTAGSVLNILVPREMSQYKVTATLESGTVIEKSGSFTGEF